LDEAKHIDPKPSFVRLDKLSALNSDECFADLVHLNGAGKQNRDGCIRQLAEATLCKQIVPPFPKGSALSIRDFVLFICRLDLSYLFLLIL